MCKIGSTLISYDRENIYNRKDQVLGFKLFFSLCSVPGYKVEKDTFIFLNNYDLNMSEKLWTSPKDFMPERFVQNGRISKPEYFLPFGGGRRSCMGYKMVQYVGFSTIATILKNFTISPVENENYTVPIGNLALPEISYGFRFERRQFAWVSRNEKTNKKSKHKLFVWAFFSALRVDVNFSRHEIGQEKETKGETWWKALSTLLVYLRILGNLRFSFFTQIRTT